MVRTRTSSRIPCGVCATCAHVAQDRNGGTASFATLHLPDDAQSTALSALEWCSPMEVGDRVSVSSPHRGWLVVPFALPRHAHSSGCRVPWRSRLFDRTIRPAARQSVAASPGWRHYCSSEEELDPEDELLDSETLRLAMVPVGS